MEPSFLSASDGSARPNLALVNELRVTNVPVLTGQLTRIEYQSRHLVFEVQSSPASAAGPPLHRSFGGISAAREREHPRVASAAAVLPDDGLVTVQGSVVLS